MNTLSKTAPCLASLALSSALVLAAMGAAQQAQAAQVGVQVSVHEPGFHGRIVIGDQPPPVVYQQPVIVQQTPVAVVQRPIYMSVPPAHYQHWAAHCAYWRACGQPVYFVPPGAVYQGRQWGGGREGWRHEQREDRRERREWRDEGRHEGHRGGEHGHHGRD
jgi:hypothetical protein